MSDSPLDRTRRICLSLPEAFEQEAWGEPTFRVRKRMFAMYANAGNHHGDGRHSLWFHAPLGVQELLIHSAPDIYFSPPYVGVRGWVGVYLDAVDDAELRELVVQAYCVVAPKRLQALV